MMKRALGLGGLIVGSLIAVAPASAAARIDLTGYYRLMYMNEVNTSHRGEPASFTDAYFQHRLNLEMSFRPTDEIAVHWRLRGPDYQRWGSGGGHELETHYIYGEIKQGWGTVLLGRLSDDLDAYGLASLGYQPATIDVFTNTGPFDRADVLDGIRYAHTWDNGFSLMAQYGKISSNKQLTIDKTGELIMTGYSDQDRDQYRVEAAYAWDGGGASLGLFYDRTATSNLIPGCGILYSVPIIIDSYAEAVLANMYRFEQWGLNPAIMHSWGDFSFHFEGMAQWGKAKYITGNTVRDNKGHRVHGPSQDAEGFGAYLDLDYNYGQGNITLAAWWASGSDLEEHYKIGGKNRSIADLVGGNFYPLLVAYNGANLNPGGNRYAVGADPSGRASHEAGRHVSAIGFANNGYINYVRDGQLGRTAPNQYGNINGLTRLPGGYNPTSNFNGSYYAINDVNGVNLNAPAGTVGIFHRDVLTANTSINRVRTLSFNEFTDANHWAVALTGNHAFTDDITMHYGLAYLALNKPNYRVSNGAVFSPNSFNGGEGWTNTSYTTQDKDLGFEIDLGFTFQLLDNLTFTTALGYMFNGDAYKQFKGYELVQAIPGAGVLNDGDVVRGRWAEADDSYVWFNSLTFAF